MRSFVTHLLFLGGASLVYSAPNPEHILQERTGSNGCNADNLLRLLRSSDTIGEAVVFCSGYLNLPSTTITVETVTPTVVVSETTTVTIVDEVEETITNTITFTNTDTLVNTVTDTITNTNTATETDTVYTTIAKRKLRKRNTKAPLTSRIATYPPERISSACSCLTIPIDIVPATYTAPAVTITVVGSETTETTKTVTETTDTSKTVVVVTETITTVTKVEEVDVTTTLTSIVTIYTTPPEQPKKFVLRSNGPGVSQHYLKAVPHASSLTVTHSIFVPNKNDATVWFIDEEGRLSYNNPVSGNAVWVSYTVGSADPREIFWNSPSDANGPFLKWKQNGNGNVVPDDPSLDKLQSCVPTEAGINGAKTLFIGTFIDNQNDCKSVDLHPEYV